MANTLIQPQRTVLLTLKEVGGGAKTFGNCVAFSYEKEYYTPYSTLKASFLLENEVLGAVIDVELAVNGTTVHKGIIDTLSVSESPDRRILTLNSRSHTSMLGQNELVPGLLSNPRPSLNVLLDNFIRIPSVFHENLVTTSDYIYVKEHTSMWEAVCNLCLKQVNRYPYIANVNTVRFNFHTPKQVVLSRSDNNIVSAKTLLDYTKLISDIHMKDTNDTYNTYNISDAPVRSLSIVRHKHVAFDKQWLSNPVQGLGYRVNFAMRGYKTSEVSYLGYHGEDINDKVSFEGMQNRYISKVNITGSSKGIVTKLTCYFDRYCNT